MFDTWLRALKDRLLAPLIARVAVRVNPLVVTLLAFAVGLGAAAAAREGRDGLALALWLGNRALDGIDGTLARVQGTQSELGGYLDILLDFIVYALLPMALVYARPTPAVWPATVALLAAFYVNAASWMYLAAVLARRAVPRDPTLAAPIPPGLIGGAETIVFYALFLVFPDRLAVLFWVFAGLVGVTIVQRAIAAVALLRRDGAG